MIKFTVRTKPFWGFATVISNNSISCPLILEISVFGVNFNKWISLSHRCFCSCTYKLYKVSGGKEERRKGARRRRPKKNSDALSFVLKLRDIGYLIIVEISYSDRIPLSSSPHNAGSLLLSISLFWSHLNGRQLSRSRSSTPSSRVIDWLVNFPFFDPNFKMIVFRFMKDPA